VLNLLGAPHLCQAEEFLGSELKVQLEALFSKDIFLSSSPVQEQMSKWFNLITISIIQVLP